MEFPSLKNFQLTILDLYLVSNQNLIVLFDNIEVVLLGVAQTMEELIYA